ncbi:MAG: hypothetical protein EU529_01080 [Promethearchaeota archaeon]|nr:MAG: hypothetical protein EU529_01080 [Candidatus Lokiarchaeota archaeon]
MAEIKNILSRLEKIFKATKLKYVIVGGIAVIHYGHIRATQDIDIIIEDDPSKFSQFLGLLRSFNFDVMEEQIKMAYQEHTNISIFDNESFLRLDIKVADKKRELDVLKNAINEKILGLELSIAPIEYVLIGKIIYMGKIDDIPDSELLEYQDIIDFLTIFHANREKVNLALISSKIEEIGLNSTLKRLLSIQLE